MVDPRVTTCAVAAKDEPVFVNLFTDTDLMMQHDSVTFGRESYADAVRVITLDCECERRNRIGT